MNKIVLITGATSGFGKACAEKFAAAGGYDLILTGRRKERLENLKRELESGSADQSGSAGKRTKVQTLEFDVQDKKAVFAAIAGLPAEWKKIDILFNNA